MNPTEKNDPEAIRSDINVTRRRMDDTMDALGDRLQPRHLLDEVLGFLRGGGNGDSNRLQQVRDKLSRSTDTAVHAVVDTVKKNPMPALLIGAGVAWMIYEGTRDKSRDYEEDYSSGARDDAGLAYDPDIHYDRPLEYPQNVGSESDWSDQGGSKLRDAKDKLAEKASSAAEGVKEKLSHVGDAARQKVGALRERAGEKLQTVKARAGEMTDKVREGTREAYTRTRERVVTTADQHPIEVGLVALAAGLIAGLALPTPNAVNRSVGATADRLRSRTREAGAEMLEKGKRVAQAAVTAVKDEAQAQGLTPERLREQTQQVADRGMDAGKQAAQQEGLTPGAQCATGTQPNDPSVARPEGAGRAVYVPRGGVVGAGPPSRPVRAALNDLSAAMPRIAVSRTLNRRRTCPWHRQRQNPSLIGRTRMNAVAVETRRRRQKFRNKVGWIFLPGRNGKSVRTT
jgi:ElaB/YqjD/DUF883 family membrane-anchored ribosome-binding protein